jgi:hypothetical protein
MKDLAPSTSLRLWVAHRPDRWERFKTAHRQELRQAEKQKDLDRLRALGRNRTVTLCYSARDAGRNDAVVLLRLLRGRRPPLVHDMVTRMVGPIYRYLEEDHNRLDGFLRRSITPSGEVDRDSWDLFRGGLLRHIGIEERILLPAATRRGGGSPPGVAERMRLDHGALAALMLPPPTRALIRTVQSILRVHNALEEQEGGLYQVCEQLIGPEAKGLLAQITSAPAVPLTLHNERPEVLEATRHALSRAGYKMVD